MNFDKFVDDPSHRPTRLARSLPEEPPPPSEQKNLFDGKLATLDERSARAAPDDKLAEFANRMQLIARVVNGISLQSGLINAEIPVDDVIAELLHMGSMKLKDLIVIPDTDITRVMDMMKKSTTKLVKTKNVTEIEDGLSAPNLDFDFAAFEKVSFNDYTVQIDTVVKELKGIDLPTFVLKFAPLKLDLQILVTLKSDQNKNLAANEMRKMEDIGEHASNVEDVFKTPQEFDSLLKSLNELVEKSLFVHRLTEVDKMIETQKAVKTDSDADANFQHFEQMSAFFDKNQKMLSEFDILLESQQSKYQSGVKYTAGLPRGCKDLDSLPSDIDDKWFQKSMKVSPGKAQSLKNGLRPLEEFKNNLKVIDEAWQPVKGRIGNARKVISQLIQIANQAKSAGTRTKKMSHLKGCRAKLTNPPPPSITAIEPLLQSIRDINDNVKKAAGMLKSELSNLSILREVVNFQGKSTAEKQQMTPRMVAKLKSMPEVPQTISNIDKFLADVRKLNDTVYTIDSQIFRNGLTTIQNHHTSLVNSGLKSWNECLKNTVGAEGEVVKDMIESIRNVRLMAHTDIDTADSVLKTILKSGSQLRAALKFANNMNTSKNSETKYLDLLKNSLKISLDLGLAAQGIAGIQQADENRLNLSGLTGDLTLTPNLAKTLKNNLSTVEHSSIQQLAPLKPPLDRMFTEIDMLKPLIENLKETDLKGYKTVFDAAAKVSGMKKVDMAMTKKTIAKMRQKSPSSDQFLKQVENSLDTLEDLDLDFAKYQVARAPSALDAVQPFFAQLPESLVSKNNVTDGSSFPWIFLLAGLGGLAAALFVGGVIYYVMKSSKKRKEEKRKQEEERRKQEEEKKKQEKQQRDAKLAEIKAYKSSVANKFFGTKHMTKKIISAFRDSKINPVTFLNEEIVRYCKIKDVDVELEKKHTNERRDTLMYHAKKSTVDLQPLEPGAPKPYINANRMKMSDKHYWIMSQAPLDGTELEKINTIEKHWMMIDQQRVAVVIQLCQFIEYVKGLDQRACGLYYPEEEGATLVFGAYSVMNVGKVELGDQFPNENNQFSAVRIQYTLKGKARTVDIMCYRGWIEDVLPVNVDPVLQLIKFADSFKANVLVHCTPGVGRTGILVAVKRGLDLSELNQDHTMDMVFTQLFECRHHAIKNGIDLLFVTLAVTKGLIKNNNYKEFVNFYPVLEFYFERIRNRMTYILNKEVEPGEYAVDLGWRDKYVDKITADWKKANPDKMAEELSEEEEKEQPKPAEKTKSAEPAKPAEQVSKNSNSKEAKKSG